MLAILLAALCLPPPSLTALKVSFSCNGMCQHLQLRTDMTVYTPSSEAWHPVLHPALTFGSELLAALAAPPRGSSLTMCGRAARILSYILVDSPKVAK